MRAVQITDRTAFHDYPAQVASHTNAFLDRLAADDGMLSQEVKVGEHTETVGEWITLHLITHLNGDRGEVNLLRGVLGLQPVLPNRGG